MYKKRVGIATWFGNTSLNYGGALQATALQVMLRRLGYEPVTIDSLPLAHGWKDYAIQFLQRGEEYTKTYFSFQAWYRKHMKISTSCYNDNDIQEYAKKNCDILLSGSDAIWSEDYACARFFWDYESLDDKPRIAYAAGTLKGKIGYDVGRVIPKYIAISGREKQLQELLKEYRSDVEVVLDPTLAISPAFWYKYSPKRLIKEDYILCYIQSHPEYHRLSVEQVREKYGVEKIVYINTDFVDKPSLSVYTNYEGQDYKGTVGPEEFLSLIRYSTAVCTDSYHGSIFSIVFQKDFFAFDYATRRTEEIGVDYRFMSLLSTLNLLDRYLKYNDEIDNLAPIDWSKVNRILEKERRHSLAFLENALASCQTFKREGF